MVEGWYIDIESDDLYLKGTKVWYMRLKTFDGSRTKALKPWLMSKEQVYEEYMEWVYSFPDGTYVGGHNIIGYDVWALWKLHDIQPRVGKGGKDWIEDKEVKFIDTYVLSMFLMPNNPKHSLEYLADGSEDEKVAFRENLIEMGVLPRNAPKGAEFKQWHESMGPYCDADVDAGIGVLVRLWRKAEEMYGDKWPHASFRQMQKDYWLYTAQAYTGVLFNVEKAKDLIAEVDARMAELKAEVDPVLPPRPLKTAEQAFYKMPAKPFSKSGELAASMQKWLVKHQATMDEDRTVHAYGISATLEANVIFPVKLPMEIDDNTELKNWFLENGWEPHDDFWNFKKDPDTKKPMRDDKGKFIRTTPKIQHQGTICPNLLKLEGEIPAKVVKYLSYRNRKGVVEGWLGNWRIEFDGRLSAEISGYAPTSRVKHRVVTNVPKADIKVLLGNEMRDLFYVPKGCWYVGTDAAALENRTLSHHTFKYDDGAFAKMQTEGDPHTFNAFAFFPEISKKFDITTPDLKEVKEFKPYRNKAKTGAYLLAFGGGAPKLASSLGLTPKAGKNAYDNYWEKNRGLGELKKAVEKYFTDHGSKYIPAVDGRLVSVRGKNVLLSCLGQGTGAISMSYAACFMDNWLGDLELDSLGRPYYTYQGHVVKRISMVHDEFSWECEDGVEETIRLMSEKAIVKAGEALKLSLPLAAEGKKAFEGSWKDTH